MPDSEKPMPSSETKELSTGALQVVRLMKEAKGELEGNDLEKLLNEFRAKILSGGDDKESIAAVAFLNAIKKYPKI